MAMIEEREKEITAIVQSISEINEMYRDLATMVVDQVITKYFCNIIRFEKVGKLCHVYSCMYMYLACTP